VTDFRVWAPDRYQVDVHVGGRRFRMRPSPDGWWHATVANTAAGTRYFYQIDAGPPRPDPRAAFQPEGIEAPSAIVDHDAFPWTDGGWKGTPLDSAVIYELHVGTFTPDATFDAAINHLDHLVDLGVGAVELMPVGEFSGDRGWGYDGVGLYAPHHAYGGPDGLKRLVDACHARGLGVLMDVVYNHLGPAGNYLAEFGPYFTDRYSTPWGRAINFDGPGSDEVRRFFIDNALMWLRDYHCDGLRLDAVHAIFDTSAVHILEQLAGEVVMLAPHLRRTVWLVAENDRNDPRVVRAPEVGGYGVNAQWCDDFHHALHTGITGETAGYYQDFNGLADLSRALRHAYVYDGRYSRYRQRRRGRPIGGLSGAHFVVFSQNHDQVGNRALGERLAALTTPGRLRIAAAIVLTSPFIPMLFEGEEWGASTPFQYFTDHRDPSLAGAVSQGRRSEFAAFGWSPEDVPDPQDPETWRRSVLRWDEVEKEPHAGLLAWYRDLIRLRRSQPVLTDGALNNVHVEAGDDYLVMVRFPIGVMCNLSSQSKTIPVAAATTLVLASADGVNVGTAGVRLAPESVAIVSLSQENGGSRATVR
jgi:maltooligosyltrehalose trehalohydrolase